MVFNLFLKTRALLSKPVRCHWTNHLPTHSLSTENATTNKIISEALFLREHRTHGCCSESTRCIATITTRVYQGSPSPVETSVKRQLSKLVITFFTEAMNMYVHSNVIVICWPNHENVLVVWRSAVTAKRNFSEGKLWYWTWQELLLDSMMRLAILVTIFRVPSIIFCF